MFVAYLLDVVPFNASPPIRQFKKSNKKFSAFQLPPYLRPSEKMYGSKGRVLFGRFRMESIMVALIGGAMTLVGGGWFSPSREVAP